MVEKMPTIQQEPQRSTFVTVLAWIFIVLSGFATFISILQNIMIHNIFPPEEMAKAMEQSEATGQIPVFAQFMFAHFGLIMLAFLIVAATTFISAIALLKRKNWARIVFIVIMSFSIIWNIFGVIMQYTMFSSLPSEAPVEFESMMTVMKVASLVMAAIFSVFFGWIIKKLSSAKIKAEFI